ncbi:MAG: DNA polymerase/3'-5' exonuclease PolX, partial [Planctomycetes bacterium]|nr:DNA polymerase/3'-5' exonuclease PolX [Planctomycetota bacterium]
MKNQEIAQVLEKIADCLEIKGESVFRQNAYRRAARALADLVEDVTQLHERGKLESIAGIGEGMAGKIEEYLKTGKIKRYEELKRDLPDSLIAMMRIQGMGPKTLKLIHDRLGINSIDELEAAAKDGKLNDLPGLGAGKTENILRGIALAKASAGRVRLGMALPLVESIIRELRNKVKLDECLPAGSLRRLKATVGDLDILAAGADGRKIIDAFTRLPHVRDVLAKGDTKGSVITGEGLQVDLRVVPPESYGAALQYFTGSKEHNVHLREIARKKKLKVNEYGVFRGEKSIAGKTEQEVYRALGLDWIPPVLRENKGEIEAAQEGKLPRLIEEKNIRGDLHVHSRWSDGKVDIEEMVNAAKEIGYEYVAISDHSFSATIANGLNVDRLLEQLEEIETLRKKIKGIAILTSTEMDIKPDGSLDFPDHVLEKLDVVTASIHSAFKQPSQKVTGRVLAALDNPHVDIIGHPTGGLIGVRELRRGQLCVHNRFHHVCHLRCRQVRERGPLNGLH